MNPEQIAYLYTLIIIGILGSILIGFMIVDRLDLIIKELKNDRT